MMGGKERIELLVRREGSAAAFAKRIGTSESSVSKLRSGAFRIEAYAARIADAYPTLNCRWLLTGKGEPFSEELSRDEIGERIEEMRKMLQMLTEGLPNH